MNQTDDETRADEGQSGPENPYARPRTSGPRVTRDQVMDIERLRRSSTDRYVSGVAGGLARHLDIDPLIVRVVFAVTAFFGVGILLYGALWLLLPDDQDHAAIDTSPETRRVLVIVAGIVAAAMLASAVFGNAWGAFPVAFLALVGLGIYAAVRDRRDRPQQNYSYAKTTTVGDNGTETTWSYETGGPDGPTHTQTWHYTPPARPRRTGPILFWPVLAVLAIALGCLAMYDLDHAVTAGAYAALALGIIGLGLLIGAFHGRAGGLILLGLLAIPPLMVTTTFGNDFTRSSGSVTDRPTTAAQVRDAYDVHSGSLRLDLTGMDKAELAKLDGRDIDIDMSAGEIIVTLPENVAYDVESQLRFAGEVRVVDRVSSGLNPVLDTSTSARPGEPTISLDINGTVGRVEIQQEGIVR